MTDAGLEAVIRAVRPYTGTPDAAIACTVDRALEAIRDGVPGDLVECGTWMGGLSFAMLLAQRYELGRIVKPVWMYDSFQGMSPPTDEDGRHAAHWWESAKDTPKDEPHNDHCIAPVEHVRAAAAQLGLTDHVRIVPGWLHETLPYEKPERVAVLRVDCDWYEPVRVALEELVPRVSEGGSIIVDDYYAWEGAALALHEYLSNNSLPWPIETIPGKHGAWLTRGPHEW